ncbi:type III secretion system outer membrane ring subunit SctC [Sphingomonas crocodyli]|uniref:Type 3 secretion system secretin n=1 Tax=Sphingomonas crocodyli TaxID=1979270 RepID=A0A437M6U9_9SPHN|nr:type III secretion system outer membrane ring subunit SctC [Sphingomonas crocodyli]RVT93285.1 EscC/YscC/HrcC family type III secretion system outer membrane ring protein [Sphingomonas crocodyli]
MPSIKRPLMLPAAAAMAAAILATPASTAPLPSAAVQVSIVARDQPVAAFVRDLFSRVGQPVVTSGNMTGTVNGSFTGTANKIFSDIAKAFNLVGYYDGAAVYVYSANELTVQTLPVGRGTAARVVSQVQSQRLADQRNLVRASGDGALVASGTPRFVEQVQALAQGSGSAGGSGRSAYLDYGASGSQSLEFRVFYLRYARAEDTTVSAGGREVTVPGLAHIIQNLVLDQRPGNQLSFGSRPVRQSMPRLKGLGLNSVAPNAQQTPFLGLPSGGIYPAQGDPNYATGGYGAGGFGGDGGGSPLSPDIVRIEANPYTNSVIVRDVPERMNAYDSLIRALDVEPQLVEVEATIIDINIDKMRELGINWRFGSGGFGALFGNGTDSDLGLLPVPGTSRRDNVTNITPSANGGTISTIIGNQRQFIGRITALEQKGAARIVSRPQVMTLSNVEAIFDRTRTFYVRVAGREEVDLFNVTAGTVLRVNPHVFRDHDQTRIRVLVAIEDGSISPESVVENIPIVERSTVNTQAMVLNGESLLLGGMTVDADVDNVSKVPLLGDIPLLGNLFKTRSKQRGHTERLFLITPRLATLSDRVGPVTTSVTTEAAQPFMYQNQPQTAPNPLSKPAERTQ